MTNPDDLDILFPSPKEFRNRTSRLDLIDPERNHGPSGTHDISISGAAYLCFAAVSALGNRHALLQGFGLSHGIDGISRLIRG